MIRLGTKVLIVGPLYLGRVIPVGTKGMVIARKSGDSGTLYIVQVGKDFLTLAPAELAEDK